MRKNSLKGMSVNRLAMLMSGALLSAVVPAHAAQVDMQGQITVATPKCDITLVPESTTVIATLAFSPAVVSSGAPGTMSSGNGAASYQVRMSGGAGCVFGNVAIKMPNIQNGPGYGQLVPLIHTSFGSIPGYPYLARVDGYNTVDNSGTPTLVTGMYHSSIPFNFVTSSTTLAIGVQNRAALQALTAGASTAYGGYNGKGYTFTAPSAYNESGSGASAANQITWPWVTNNRIAGVPHNGPGMQSGIGDPANFINIPSASLSNYKSLTVRIGMLLGLQTYIADVVDNSAAIDGDTFTDAGTLEVTVS